MTVGTLENIREFLRQRRWALVGVSRRRLDFSRWLLGELRRRGYEVVPVNPHVAQMDGMACYPQVSAIQPPPDVALVLTHRRQAAAIARDCAAAGVRRVWFYAAVGRGAVSSEALALCRQADLQVVAGYCPVMFLPAAPWPHRTHAALLRLLGRYPANGPAQDGPPLKPGEPPCR
ncbi:MAG: CoA-binding protein [Bryobacterales bacterium]|nr:CoA-binding protein [Bryobacteraceae bacterium]MDW8129005.1 CoA-binding protein [Bryobacterales bacterium]